MTTDLRKELLQLLMESYDRGVADTMEAATAAAQAAVAAERQRCAQIAREFDHDHPNTNYGGYIARLIEEQP